MQVNISKTTIWFLIILCGLTLLVALLFIYSPNDNAHTDILNSDPVSPDEIMIELY